MSRLIDADKIIKEVCENPFVTDSVKTYVKCSVEEQPTIDAVEVVRGEWVHDQKIGWGETWVCSICGEKTTSSIMGKPRYKYCPMCGAKMDGESA